MGKKIKIVQMGIGPIGSGVTRLLAKKKNMEITGAVDLSNVGQDLGHIAGVGKNLGVVISNDLEKILNEAKPDVVIHTTSSSIEKVCPELETLIKSRTNVISSTEELSFPFREHPQQATRIDKLARDCQVTVLGTGVNPGFIMDAWPLFMTSVCAKVEKVRIRRIQDASKRRLPFQKKIGAGKTLKEFNKLVAEGSLKHVGLPESVAMIAGGLGWELDDITETIEPIVCKKEVSSEFINIKPGQATGVKQVGYGRNDGKALITLEFEASVGGGESYDAIYITGTPSLEVIINGGTHGDIATAAILVNSIPRVIKASPGLITMKDLVVCAQPSK